MKIDQLKQFFWVAMVMIIPVTGFAQKPNTKMVSIKYVQPPSTPLGADVKTYFVKVINEAASFQVSTNSAADAISLEGYERSMTSNDADVYIEVVINNVDSEGSVQKTTWRKKINDSTYVDRTGGKWVVNAYMNVNYMVKNEKTGQTLSSDSRSFQKNFESDNYKSYNDAVYASNENKGNKAKALYKELFVDVTRGIKTNINDAYGYPVRSTTQPVARGKGKKHDYTDLESAYTKFVQASQLHESQGLNEDVATLLKDCVFTWENAAQEYDSNKKARIGEKNIGHINYNIAVAKVLLQDWTGAQAALEKAKGTKVSMTTIKDLQGLTADLQQRHTANQ